MPILVAIVEALGDPVFRLEDAGSTPGWEPLVTVSGPLAAELGFNSETAVLRAGHRANTSVGRFVRLYMRNVCGIRQAPDETDQGAIAGNFFVALAENEQVIRTLGWPSHSNDRGFRDDDTTATVRGVLMTSQPIYSGGSSAADHLSIIAAGMADTIGPWPAARIPTRHSSLSSC